MQRCIARTAKAVLPAGHAWPTLQVHARPRPCSRLHAMAATVDGESSSIVAVYVTVPSRDEGASWLLASLRHLVSCTGDLWTRVGMHRTTSELPSHATGPAVA